MPLMLRNILLITIAHGLFFTGASMMISILALVGQSLAANPAWATVPVAMTTVGIMLGTLPAAHLNKRFGRSLGSIIGVLIAMAGTGLMFWGLVIGSFALVTAAALPIGVGNAFAAHYRFAAAEAANEAWRARAISWSMVGGVMAGFLGPYLAASSQDALWALPFLGTVAVLGVLQLISIAVLSFVRITPPQHAPELGTGRPLREIFASPKARFALTGAAIGYALMVLVMTATPLAVVGCGYAFADSAFIIQWHVVGMFAPGFFTGSLIKRFGVVRVMAAGAGAYLLAAVFGLSGLDLYLNFWPTLVLLGVGWNFLFIGGTNLLTDCYRPEERARVQGFNDLVVFASVAVASLGAGGIYATIGWHWVVMALIPPALIVLGLIGWRDRRHRMQA